MSYSPSYEDAFTTAFLGALAVYYVIALAIGIITIIAYWKLFTKAGKPGWAAIVPFYNLYCMYDIAMGNGWLFLLMFVPCANFIVAIIMNFQLAKAYGEGIGYGFGLLFLPYIFLPILAFGKSEYVGPNGTPVVAPTVVNNNYTINNYNSTPDTNAGNFSNTDTTSTDSSTSADTGDDNPYYH